MHIPNQSCSFLSHFISNSALQVFDYTTFYMTSDSHSECGTLHSYVFLVKNMVHRNAELYLTTLSTQPDLNTGLGSILDTEDTAYSFILS